MPTRAELFADYEATIVSVRPADAAAPGAQWTDPALVGVERCQGAHVLTAWNPGFVVRTEADNLAANRRLLADLVALGVEVWAADGATPDGRFHEPGFCAWGMTRERAVQVARHYDQFAVFEYTETGERAVIACDD